MNRAIFAVLGKSAIALLASTMGYTMAQGALFSPAQASPVIVAQETSTPRDVTTTESIEALLRNSNVTALAGDVGRWQFEYDGVFMMLVTNEEFDRIRLVAPIAGPEEITAEQLQKMLIANFHTALDVRYAIGGLSNRPAVVSVFVHPLSSLTDDFFYSALDQVSSSVQTFGTTYSSGELVLQQGSPDESVETDEPLGGIGI